MVYNFAIIFSIIFIIFILNLVRKNKLDEKYSILWIIFGCIILAVSIFPGIITRIAQVFDIYYPPSLLFLIGFLIMGTYIVHITMVITKQNKMIVKLTQELAIIKEKSEELINIKFRNFSVIPNFIDPDNFKFEKKDIE